jgi:glycosyltransferase involved in cell wall biosynthesis
MQATSLKNNRNAHSDSVLPKNYDMVVFCHLRWDFVYQRPQHIISRMAKHYRILFIEEPLARGDEEDSRLIAISDMLDVLQPNVDSVAAIEKLLPTYISKDSTMAGWFYSPSFAGLLNHFDFSIVIYDCMDELSLFRGAPQALVEQERYLLARADIVFTGGKSLYESKAKLHRNVHCLPSSVDQFHFAKALNGIAVPVDMASIASPVVGYFGVIDERIDLRLLEQVAARRPDVSFVMIGPLAKIGEGDLPRKENIHYLGMKDYKELPAYIKAFDLAMMPFALNDATRFISPTKTLEYMAAHKPIVSTAITDVVRDYSHCVSIIHNAEEFEAAINEATDGIPNPFTTYEYNIVLEKTSWNNTANAMLQHIKAIAQ